jgi:DNA-directed RNA polymerase specialized sigma subunit
MVAANRDINTLAARDLSYRRNMLALWEAVSPIAVKVGRIFAARYSVVDADDLSQNLLSSFPRLVKRYKTKYKTPFDTFCYYTFYYAAQDELRKLDPLGIKYPQKRAYPVWRYLEDVTDQEHLRQSIIMEGWSRLEKERGPNS